MLLTARRSASIYRSFSALTALIRFSLLEHPKSVDDYHIPIYAPFAADGRIFHLQTLADSLKNYHDARKYLTALVDLGNAALITSTVVDDWHESDTENLRSEILNIITSQLYVPSPPQ